MPLHLLHHKSYNVYSATNIERVRRDEAAARAKEEAEEQRMQEADAEHRVKVLRARAGGGVTPSLEEKREEPTISRRFVAPKDSAQAKENETRLIGPDGHINLFSGLETPHPQRNFEKNAEYEAEKKAKEDKLEAQCTMGLGKPADELRPWYSTLDMVGEIKGRRKTEWETKKEGRRKDWGDPLVAIRRGVRGVKEVEEERKEWKRSRELEVGALGLDVLSAEGSDGVKRARIRSRSREYKSRQGISPSRNHDQNKHRGRSRSRSRSRHHHHSRRHNKRKSSTEPTSHRHRQHRTSRSRSRRHRSSRGDTMERLRRERDQRERDEREKAESMLKKEKEYRLPGWKAVDGGRYSSQFGIGEVRKR